MSINLSPASIIKISEFSSSFTFPDYIEIFGDKTSIQKLSELKSLSFTATKFLSYELQILKKSTWKDSAIPAFFQIEIISQTVFAFVRKIMIDNFDIFPDDISLDSVENAHFGKIYIGDTMEIRSKITQIDHSFIGFEISIEKNKEKISEGTFRFRLENSRENSLCIIKPDAVKADLVEQILAVIEKNEIKISCAKKSNGNTDLLRRKKILTESDCRSLYEEHLERPFYSEIQNFMTSGESVVCVLEGSYVNGVGCIKRYRELMGATDPQQALPGTIRYFAGSNKGENAVHGSDSPAAALREIPIFFPELRIWPKILMS